LVSIVIPTHNRSSHLLRAVESIRGQTFTDWELVIVDDGSTDDTRSAVSRIRDGRIVYTQQEHSGVSAARNAGIRLARRSWVSFLDSDDYWQSRKLERQIATLAAEPAYKVLYTNEIWIRNGVRVNQRKLHRKYGGWIFEHCVPLCIISPSSVLMHRDVLEEEGTFDETFTVCEDYELWLRIAARRPVRFLDEPLIVKTGGHEDQLSRRYWGMDRWRIEALRKAYCSGRLSSQQRLWTAAGIVRKASILVKGFLNRGKPEEAKSYLALISTWSKLMSGGTFLHPGTAPVTQRSP
jgi:glycosyltransferase involved in cell wall biosynthesis